MGCSAILLANDPICISINKSDLEKLDGWPLNRKWYNVALQNIVNGNAGSIYLDLAFPDKNLLYPEADELLYDIIVANSQIFILSHYDDLSNKDSIQILGSYSLPISRFILPFSSYIEISRNNLILDGSKENTLLFHLLKENRIKSKITVPLPNTPLNSNYNFIQVLKSPIDFQGKDVFIFLDYPGVTSYIVGKSMNETFTPSMLQVYGASSISKGEYYELFPRTILIILFCFTLLPIIFIRRYKQIPLLVLFSYMLIALLCTILFLYKVDFLVWSFYTAIIPGLFLLSYFYFKQIDNRSERNKKDGKIQITDIYPNQNREIKRLKEKLRFFEHLTNQEKPKSNIDLPDYLQLHPQSPLIPTMQKIEQIALTDIPVLIIGESGTGKEQVAKFLHEKSTLKDNPFIAVNCASLNENLIESELFGHEAGAFTGATKQKEGKFDLANGGILFLDEICETSLSIQIKLLRVLQEGVFERVGGVESINVGVRIVAATNKNPFEEIANGSLREDLYYRLNGYTINLAPLRERKMDVEFLFKYFLYSDAANLQVSDSIIDWLKERKWNGNVRELKSATKRAVINAKIKKRNFLLPEDFELNEPDKELKKDQLHDNIINELRKDGFKHRSISNVGRQIGIHRATVTEYLRGWIIRYLVLSDFEEENVYQSLVQDAQVDNTEKLKERISGYVKSIKTNISLGLNEQISPVMIKQIYFKNLPHEFENDLLLLIKKMESLNSQ